MPGARPLRDPWAAAVIQVWNTLGGLEWAGLPLVLARLGLEEHADRIIDGLVLIRDRQRNDANR